MFISAISLITTHIPTLPFTNGRVRQAALTMLGVSCAEPDLDRDDTRAGRPPELVQLADRRRTPSGIDDQHLLTVNL